MRHSMKPDLRADYKIRLYTGPQNPFFEVSMFLVRNARSQFSNVPNQSDNFIDVI